MQDLLAAVDAAIIYFEARNLGGAAPAILGQLRRARNAHTPKPALRQYTIHSFPPDKRITVIKILRAATGMALVDAVSLIHGPFPLCFAQTQPCPYGCTNFDWELRGAGVVFFAEEP